LTDRDRLSGLSLNRVVEIDLDSPSTRTGLRSSVVIAAYNAERSLAETLDSLEVQTLRPHEIIVVDDGSTDRTSEIANDHAVDVTLIRTPNRGMCAARNEAIEASSGDLICILDADDLWHPRYVERMTSMMERHPEAGSGFSRYRAWQSPIQKPAAWEDGVDGGHHLHDLESFLSIGRSGLPVLPSFHVTRREVLLRLGARPFREDQVQGEAAFLLALLGAIAPVAEHVAPLGRYRMHSAAMTGDEMDAARRIEPCIDDLRSAAGGTGSRA
jgi:glycosyltransferase involved in cell wall biosynthesis